MPYIPSVKKEPKSDSDSETKEEKAAALFSLPALAGAGSSQPHSTQGTPARHARASGSAAPIPEQLRTFAAQIAAHNRSVRDDTGYLPPGSERPPVWGPMSMRRRCCIECRKTGPSTLFSFNHGRAHYLPGPYCRSCEPRPKSAGYRDGPALPGHSQPRAWSLHD